MKYQIRCATNYLVSAHGSGDILACHLWFVDVLDINSSQLWQESAYRTGLIKSWYHEQTQRDKSHKLFCNKQIGNFFTGRESSVWAEAKITLDTDPENVNRDVLQHCQCKHCHLQVNLALQGILSINKLLHLWRVNLIQWHTMYYIIIASIK